MVDPLFFDELIAWVEKNISQKLRLEDVARKSGFSLWHLQRIFKKHTGKTLGAYIKKVQMESAGMDIISGGCSITDIALKYGYDSQQSFTRAFGQYYGMPPAAYRKNSSMQSLSDKNNIN